MLVPELRLLLATGFCGAYTISSAFANESVALIQTGQVLAGVGNILATNALCLLAVLLGLAVGSRF